MIKLSQLSHRNLETKVQFDIEQADGTFKKEDFRIVTRDMPQAEFQKLLDDVKAETDAAFAAWEKRKAEFEAAKKTQKARVKSDDDFLERVGTAVQSAEFQQIVDSAKTAVNEKYGEETEESFTEPPPPTEQHLFHSRIVAKLPDLVGDDGSVAEPVVETFARLGQNVNLVINEAIWRRRTEIDPKK